MVDFRAPGRFTLDDFRRLLDEARRLGPRGKLMGLLPRVSQAEETVERHTQEQFSRVQGIIDAMTPEERRDPEGLLDESRLRRVAAGAGVRPGEVEDLLRQFHGMAEIMDELFRAGPGRDWPR